MWAAVMIRLMDTSVKRTWASSAQQASISRFRFSSGNRKNVAVGTVSPLYDRLSQYDRLSCIIQKPLYPVKAGIVKLLLRCPGPHRYAPAPGMSTIGLPKKYVKPLCPKRFKNPPKRRSLPDVYQFNFFTSKSLLFRRFPPVLQSPNPMQGS